MGTRWWLLAEDPRHERLALRVARAFGLNDQPIKAWRSPEGKGSASDWVVRQFPQRVRETTRKRPTERVALIVMIDGDNMGVAQRKRSLDESLVKSGQSIRADNEPVVVLVPTWSIETWLLGKQDESVSFKNDLRRGDEVDEQFKAVAARLKARQVDGSPTSLQDACIELNRISGF